MPTLSRKIFKSFTQLFTGQGINFVSSLLSGYAFALFLGPASYGVWQTARVFLNYGTFTSLGIPFAMRREFIILRSEGKKEEAERLAHVAMSYNVIVNPLIALVFVAIAVMSNSPIAFRVSLFVVGLMYVTTFFSGIGELLHRGINDYKTVSTASILYGIGLICIIPFVYFYGFYALLAGYFIVTVLKSAYFYFKRPITYKWVWDFPVLKKMMRIGFPLFLVSITTILFSTIDRLLIAGLLDFKNVGFYSLSTFLAQPITLFLTSFSIVIFTQLNEKYGSRKDAFIIERQTYLPQKIFSNLLPPLIGVLIVILPQMTVLLLPEYTDGILAAQINIFAIFFFKLASFSSSGLFTLDKQKYTAISFFIAGSFKTIGSYWGLKAGYGIESVALFSLIAYFLYNTLMLYHINRCLGFSINTFLGRLHESLFCPLTILILSVVYLHYNIHLFEFLSITNEWIQMLTGILLMCLVSSGFLIKAYFDIKSLLKK